jgi:NAD(P)-dependent dehydrogenase (short-subunit alcohol dehydrogenase family)
VVLNQALKNKHSKTIFLEHLLTSPSLNTPVAVVTGGARGIGLAIGNWFLAHDYRVALIDIDAETLKQAEKTLNLPDRVLAIHSDVSKPDQVQAAIDLIEKTFGRIDAVINNAGVAVFKPIGETTFEEFRHVLGTNLDGAFLCSQACVPVMKKGGKGGAIVGQACS